MRAQRDRDGAKPLYTLSLAEAREADLASIRAAGGDVVDVREVLDGTVPGPAGPVPIRRYRPVPGDRLPTLVYFFGGGWTLGNLDTCDGICRTLATTAGCQVIAVGYRLAPEARFPAAVHDCADAVTWIAAHPSETGTDPARLAVGGDSAGGNLAAAVTLLAARRGGPRLVGQLLVYPNTEYGARTASMRDNADPLLFNRTSVDWYWSHYLADPADGADPLASPLRAPDLAGLPPALVITAEYDPLRDEGEAYAHRLRSAGVPTTLTRYDGMVHGFFAMAGTLDAGRVAQDQAAAQLVAWFTRPTHVDHAGSTPG
jgi:acetyl esterase